MPMTTEPVAHTGQPALAVKAFGITDKGLVRPSNEDQFLSAELTKTMRIWQTSLPESKAQFGLDRGHLFLVADVTSSRTWSEGMKRAFRLKPTHWTFVPAIACSCVLTD